jgi:hypothetical protein
MGEGPITLTLHGLTFGGIVMILAVSLRQHKIWTRMKDRLNTLWYHHCEAKGEPFVPLDNGNH